MNRYEYIIAVDPDIDKSGVATLRTSDRKMEVETISFPCLVDRMQFWKVMAESAELIILVEASWLSSNNWHVSPYDSKASAAAKGNSVGRNHETGRKIIEMAKHYGLKVEEIRPLKKCWKGPEGKITHEEVAYFIPGLPARTNQEQRDAALIGWNYSGFPIRVKAGTKLKELK
jgi:hypothetical protein